MKKVRWGILSTAGIAQKALIPAFQRSNNAEVVAIASQSGQANEVAQRFGISLAYDSYDELLNDSSIDAVYIPLPNHLHKKWVIEAARKGKHILCEKPAALTTEEVLEMKQACEKYDVLFMEAYMYHFHPQHQRVKEIIKSGEIGDVKFMRAGFSFVMNEEDRDMSIKMSAEKGGGSIYDVGCYAIHSIRNILGDEPTTAHVHAIVDPTYNVDTDVVGYLTFPNHVRASFDASFHYARRAEYEVFGTEGRISVPRAYRPDWNGGDGLVVVEKQGATRTETLNADQYKEQVEHLSDAIVTDQDTLAHDIENTIRNMRVIDACLQSIHEKSAINVKK